MRISVRLALAFGAMIALLLGVCAYSAATSSRLAGGIEVAATVDLPRVQRVGQLQQQAGFIARASRELLLVDSAGQIKKQRESVQHGLAETERIFEKLANEDATGANASALAAVQQARDQYVSAVGKFLGTLDAGNPEDARTALLIELRPVQAAYEKTLDTLADEIGRQASERAATGQQTAHTLTQGAVLLGAIGLALAVSAGLIITRSITIPLAQAIRVAQAIKSGDLRSHFEVRGRDDIAILLTAMRDMQAHLTEVINDVAHAARDVAASALEIAHGNADLSSRTERTATHLQQTASAMAQIAVTVSDASGKSHEAAAAATVARAAVIEGGTSVGSLVDTMSRIAESSHRIKDITSVIDGIAFQTNILALNAAVEAARAGEHGRGFNVVASEVRTLAARASDAAREIKLLIDDSSDKVVDGTRTVADVGARIEGIVTEVVGMRQLIEAVSLSSHQQEIDMGSVNARVADLDQATQQNAALVEQLAATTESLTSNAKRLVSTVDFFRVPATP